MSSENGITNQIPDSQFQTIATSIKVSASIMAVSTVTVTGRPSFAGIRYTDYDVCICHSWKAIYLIHMIVSV